MPEFFMGQELTQVELPANTPRPPETPPEGVIVTDIDPDGWARKYLYTSYMGAVDEVLIREIPPARSLSQGGMGARLGGAPTAFMTKPVSLRMGQAVGPGLVPQRPPSAPAAPPPPPSTPAKCPGPLEMPDGRIIQPDDNLTLTDLCEITPFLYEAYRKAEGQTPSRAPSGPLPISSGRPGAPVPGSGFPSMGPSTGSFGGGGGAPPTSQLGVVPGNQLVNPNIGPAGPAGPAGPPGPAGPGAEIDFVVKTDGNFTAGPGAFVAVPGTSVAFTQGSDGGAVIMVQAVIGDPPVTDAGQSAQIGLRVDGSDQPLTVRLLHTFAGGVGEFALGQATLFPFTLAAGPHTVELLFRSLTPGEFGGGTGVPQTLQANSSIPLAVVVLHR